MTQVSEAAPWAIDVDGTLVDLLSTRVLRPYAADLIGHLVSVGVPVVIWSAGGADYARRTLATAPFAAQVRGYYDKIVGANGRWRPDVFDPVARPTTFVDDDVTGLPDQVRVIKVWPFISPNPSDRRLLDVLRIAQDELPCVRCCQATGT